MLATQCRKAVRCSSKPKTSTSTRTTLRPTRRQNWAATSCSPSAIAAWGWTRRRGHTRLSRSLPRSREAIHTVGKLKKIFGSGGGENTAGMGSVSIHTQPKGAQVVVNQRILDKMSPVDVMMGPGTYVVDITLTGFKPVHKVVSVEKGGKIAIDEVLERQ